jgi:hypothetical protein
VLASLQISVVGGCLPATRAFISSNITSAIFPKSSVEVVGALSLTADKSGYVVDKSGYNDPVIDLLDATDRCEVFLLPCNDAAGVDSDQKIFGLV